MGKPGISVSLLFLPSQPGCSSTRSILPSKCPHGQVLFIKNKLWNRGGNFPLWQGHCCFWQWRFHRWHCWCPKQTASQQSHSTKSWVWTYLSSTSKPGWLCMAYWWLCVAPLERGAESHCSWSVMLNTHSVLSFVLPPSSCASSCYPFCAIKKKRKTGVSYVLLWLI